MNNDFEEMRKLAIVKSSAEEERAELPGVGVADYKSTSQVFNRLLL